MKFFNHLDFIPGEVPSVGSLGISEWPEDGFPAEGIWLLVEMQLRDTWTEAQSGQRGRAVIGLAPGSGRRRWGHIRGCDTCWGKG